MNRSSIIGLPICLLLLVACNEKDTVETNFAGVGAEHVATKLSALCVEGDYQQEDSFSGSYQLTQKKPVWFPYPRRENIVQDTLAWEETTTLKPTLEIDHQESKLTATLTIGEQTQQFSGSISEPDSKDRIHFCFHGELDLPIEGAESTAHLYARGSTAKDPGSPLEAQITIGVTAKKGEESKQYAEILIPVKAEKATANVNGLFVVFKDEEQQQTALFIDDELTLRNSGTTQEVYAEALYERDNNNEIPLNLRLQFDPSTSEKVAVAMEWPNGSLETFEHCRLQADNSERSFRGSFDCSSEEDAEIAIAGQFYLTPLESQESP